MPKGKMTIEKLAGFIQDSFSTFEVRFDGLDQRFQSLEDRMERRFNEVDQRFSEIDERFTRVDTDLTAIRRQVAQAVYQPELVALERRITRVEKKVGIERK